MNFTEREVDAIRLMLYDIWHSDPYKDLLDADWDLEEAEEILASLREKLGVPEDF